MTNLTPILIMMGINLVLFVGMPGSALLDPAITDTLIINQTDNTLEGLNSTTVDFTEVTGSSGLSLGSVFQGLLFVVEIFGTVIIGSLTLPLTLLGGGFDIPQAIALPVGSFLLLLNVMSVVMFVRGSN